jgi:hypothetical protein
MLFVSLLSIRSSQRRGKQRYNRRLYPDTLTFGGFMVRKGPLGRRPAHLTPSGHNLGPNGGSMQ